MSFEELLKTLPTSGPVIMDSAWVRSLLGAIISDRIRVVQGGGIVEIPQPKGRFIKTGSTSGQLVTLYVPESGSIKVAEFETTAGLVDP